MALNLFAASNQWATRPDDERFWTLEEAYRASREYAVSAREKKILFRDLRTEVIGGDLHLVGKANNPARISHWAFGQLAQRAGAPAGYLRTLPATLAAQNVNHGLKARGQDETDSANVLFHTNGSLLCRAFTSDVYGRFWNHEVIERALWLESQGWRVPPARPAREGQSGARPATEKDILSVRGAGGGLSVNVGDLIAPAGIYLSDHDSFIFLINEHNRIQDGTPEGLCRGSFIKNSEVGASYLWICRFLFRGCCGNHIVWDASEVTELRFRHVGVSIGDRFREAIKAEVSWVNRPASVDEVRIQKARTFLLGDDKEKVLDLLFGKRQILDITKDQIERAYSQVVPDVDGDPRTAWGYAQGLTRLSQGTSYQDERDTLDRAAGKVVEFAF